ncbi:hypothetical protein DRN77_03120 [Methanosarcinales archaeon]|nr:MAG: hypothetical protein DRN77_03120 [Methanosarcinales archaeon]
MLLEMECTSPQNCVCDFTYNFYWQHQGRELDPDGVIPCQLDTGYTYRDLVTALRRRKTIHIRGDVGKRLCSNAGADMRYFGGTGGIIDSGTVIVDGNVGTRMGMGMVSGEIYVSGTVAEPMGNVIEVKSDRAGFRKFRSITDLLHGGSPDGLLPPNSFDGSRLTLSDGILRDSIAARCSADRTVVVNGNADISVGILMKSGELRICGDVGMNAGALLAGGTVVIEGNAGEFAAADMRSGVLIIKGRSKGFVGGKMSGGVIFLKGGGAVIPPVRMVSMTGRDYRLLMRTMHTNQIEAMMYTKYSANGL